MLFVLATIKDSIMLYLLLFYHILIMYSRDPDYIKDKFEKQIILTLNSKLVCPSSLTIDVDIIPNEMECFKIHVVVSCGATAAQMPDKEEMVGSTGS